MLLTDLLEAQEAVGRLLVPFLTHDERLRLLALNRAMVHSSFRREVFATSSWTIPPTRWLAHRVLRDFTMKNDVTSVVLKRCEWQQPLLRHFPALCKVTMKSKYKITLIHWHFPAAQITALDLGQSNISDMATLVAFPNLKSLRLPEDINLDNIHALESLQELRSLAVGFSSEKGGVKDLSFLEKLPELTELNLEGFDGDLAPLGHLKKLENLNVTGCHITDLRPLQASAATLKFLEASEVNLSGWRPDTEEVTAFFASLVSLQQLGIVETPLLEDVGLAPLASLVNLKSLELGEEDYDDLSPLASLTELKVLRIKGGPGTDWSPIANMKKLETLDQLAPVVSTDPSAASVLASLPNLRELSSPVALSSDHPLPQVRSLSISSHSKESLMAQDMSIPVDLICPNVEILRLKGCFDLARLGLSNLKKLDDLILVELETAKVAMEAGRPVLPIVHLIDYTPIAELHNLSKLAVSNTCRPKNYNFLENLVNLRYLNMIRQTISDISVLSKLTHLEKLVLWESPVEDITHLRNLRNLRELNLEGTRVKDVSCLRGLPYLSSLTLPDTANCTTLLDDYGVSLPSIRNLDHRNHKCKVLNDTGVDVPELEFVYIDGLRGRVDLRPVVRAETEYFKRVKLYI